MKNRRVFISTTGNGLARAAEDAGGIWSVEMLLAGQDVRCLANDPLDPGTLYAGTQGSGVLRSDDRGLTWHRAGLNGHIVKSLAASPHQPGVVYAGTKPPCLFVSYDGGECWKELEAFRRIPFRWLWRSPAEPPGTAYIQAVALSPSDPGVILAGVEFGAVVRSQDGGQSWLPHRRGAMRDCHSLCFHARDGAWAYEGGAGLRGGAAVSRDGGQTWQQPSDGMDRRYGWAVAADPERPEVWYVSAAPLGLLPPPPAHVDGRANAAIFRAAGGAPWEKLRGGLPQPLDYMAYALLTDPSAPGHLYAGTSNGDIWHSLDYGDNWRKLPVNVGAIRCLQMMRGQGAAIGGNT
jgi:hypothetical protein